jgi:hypothetical protein
MLQARHYAQSITDFDSSKSFENNVVCNVQFGSPDTSGDCVHVGICRVMADLAHGQSSQISAKSRCQQASAIAGFNQEGRFSLFFPQAGIKPCTERAIFKNKYLPVPVAHVFEDNMHRALGTALPMEIPVGRYPILVVSGGYRIDF